MLLPARRFHKKGIVEKQQSAQSSREEVTEIPHSHAQPAQMCRGSNLISNNLESEEAV